MLILSLDCAGHGCGVSVWRDGMIMSERREEMERGQDQRLMPLIIESLQQASISFAQLDRIAVTRGPGSFTGLRIGLAAARGLGLAAGKPVIGIDRFSIFREAFKNAGKDILVVISSRRAELYCRYYPQSGDAEAAAMMTADEIQTFLAAKKDVLVTGDIPAPLFAGYQPLTESEQNLAARLAATADPQDPDFLPRPLYVRAPDVTMPKAAGVTGIQLLQPRHAEAMAALHNQSFGKAAWSLAQFAGSLKLDTTRGWGVFTGKDLVGFVLCQLIPDQSEILAFCVHPTYRRKGLGEKLMLTAAAAAREKGSNLYLEVASDNEAALRLYKKIGFRQTGHRPRYYQIGKVAVDAILFTLSATPADLPRA